MLDYLAPVSRVGLLRELSRVLEAGGLLFVAARLEGPATGDPSRPEPVDAQGAVRATASELGFREVSVSHNERSLRLLLERAEHRPPAFATQLPATAQ